MWYLNLISRFGWEKTNEKTGTRDFNTHPSSTLQKHSREGFLLAPWSIE